MIDAGCPDENVLADFTTGQLPPAAARQVEEHLDRCHECRRLLGLMVRSRAPLTGGPALARPPLGELLAGRFRLGPRLGRGGMGEVYQARDELLDAPVAVKLLLPEIAQQADILQHLHREILVGRRISHPNVCRLHDLWTHGDRHFITMELVVGETLESRLRRAALTPAVVAEILDQVLGALAAAHREGVVHRDLKPGNIMLGEDGRVKVMDFGLARDLRAEHTLHCQPVGTPAYWAPEQARGEPVTVAVDVYALGLCTYQMLTGRPLPRGARDTLRALPPAFRPFVGRCLKERPEERFASVPAARVELGRLRRARRSWRGPVWALAGAVALGGIGVAAWGYRRGHPLPPAAPAIRAVPVDAAAVQRRRARLARAVHTHFIDLAAGPRIRAHLAQADEALRRGDPTRASAHLDDAERLLE